MEIGCDWVFCRGDAKGFSRDRREDTGKKKSFVADLGYKVWTTGGVHRLSLRWTRTKSGICWRFDQVRRDGKPIHRKVIARNSPGLDQGRLVRTLRLRTKAKAFETLKRDCVLMSVRRTGAITYREPRILLPEFFRKGVEQFYSDNLADPEISVAVTNSLTPNE